MRLDRIIVGIDFSDGSFAAARWAATQFGGIAELVLTHVIALPAPPPIVRRRYPRRDLLLDTLRAGAEKRLRELAHSMASGRIWLEVREAATPVAGLATVAADYRADLIVTGAHGERLGLGDGLGSTAQATVETVDVPVMLAPIGDPRPITRILVPVSDAVVALAALRVARVLAEPHDARVATLHVHTSGVMSHALLAAATVSGTTPPDAELLARRADVDDRWWRLAIEAGIAPESASSEDAFGEPATSILAAAERSGVDVIVMGRRAHGSVRRAVLGSVTATVLRRAPCSVVVVPEPRSTQETERAH